MVIKGRRNLITTFVALLPASRIKNRIFSIAGHQVDARACISPILCVGDVHLAMAPHSRIGFGNIIRNTQVTLGEEATIGQWNWISSAVDFTLKGSSEENDSQTRRSLQMATGSALTSRHYLDCSGSVTIGALAIVGGHRSTMLTHQIDFASNIQESAPIHIGNRCFVSTNCVVTMGAVLPDESILAAGSVLGRTRTARMTRGIYRGNPAVRIGEATGDYFERTIAIVHVRRSDDSLELRNEEPPSNG